jgi:hypothetical protein
MQNAVPTRALSTRTLLTGLRAFCPEVEETTKASPQCQNLSRLRFDYADLWQLSEKRTSGRTLYLYGYPGRL